MTEQKTWTQEAISLADTLIDRANSDLLQWEREGGIGVDPVTKLKTKANLAGFGLLADAVLGVMLDGSDEDSIANALKEISASTREAAETISDAMPEETPGPTF